VVEQFGAFTNGDQSRVNFEKTEVLPSYFKVSFNLLQKRRQVSVGHPNEGVIVAHNEDGLRPLAVVALHHLYGLVELHAPLDIPERELPGLQQLIGGVALHGLPNGLLEAIFEHLEVLGLYSPLDMILAQLLHEQRNRFGRLQAVYHLGEGSYELAGGQVVPVFLSEPVSDLWNYIEQVPVKEIYKILSALGFDDFPGRLHDFDLSGREHAFLYFDGLHDLLLLQVARPLLAHIGLALVTGS